MNRGKYNLKITGCSPQVIFFIRGGAIIREVNCNPLSMDWMSVFQRNNRYTPRLGKKKRKSGRDSDRERERERERERGGGRERTRKREGIERERGGMGREKEKERGYRERNGRE